MTGGRQPGFDQDDDDYGYGNNRNDLLDIIPERFSDEPTAEEEPQKGRGLLMGAALVGIAVAGAAAWYLFSGSSTPQAQVDGVPTIAATDDTYKVKPEQPGGMQVPNQDKQVYQRLNPADTTSPTATQQQQQQVERLLPTPAQPKAPPAVDPMSESRAAMENTPPPAPALSTQPQATTRPPSVLSTPAPAPVAPAPVATTHPTALAPTTSKPATIAAAPTPQATPAPATPAPAPQQKTAMVTPPAPATPAAPAASAGVPSGSGTGPFTIQLAALRDEASARKVWQQMQQKYPALLGSLSLAIEKSDQGAKGVFYRVRGTGLPSEERARYVCAELSKDKVGCLFVGK